MLSRVLMKKIIKTFALMKIINSLLLLLDDALTESTCQLLGFCFLLLKSYVHVVQDVYASDQSTHPKFSLNALVLFPKLTVIVNSFAHKVARNNFSIKHSFFSSIYCLLTLRMSSLVCQVAITISQSQFVFIIYRFVDSITSKSIKLHQMLPLTV